MGTFLRKQRLEEADLSVFMLGLMSGASSAMYVER